jgi:hypothetical protein
MPITPDAKDWTWVLERPCPECGFDARAFDHEQVGAMIRENAATWQQILDRGDEVTARPTDEQWSALEYACHARDVFRLYDQRLALMLAEDDPQFLNWDQDLTAIEDRYDQQDPTRVADELATAASALADRFDGVRDAQWARPGRRSDGAVFTIETFARYFVHDPIHHVHDVEHGFAALGTAGRAKD